MAFIIEPFENITFEIPDGKGKTVEISVPPLDCFLPEDIRKMNQGLKDIPEDTPDAENPNVNAPELVRYMLAYFTSNKAQKEAISRLVPRHLSEIDKVWSEESGIDLGKSESSTDTSSETSGQE